jgi:hypothetical protein
VTGLFGRYIAKIRDIDGDGYVDILVAAHRENPDGSPDNAGRAYLFSGRTGALLRTFRSPNEEEQGFFSHSVESVADLDGDGLDDVLIGARFETPPGGPDQAGRAYVMSSATGALLRTLDSPLPAFRGQFGFAVNCLPDQDGNPTDRYLVGAALEPQAGETDRAGRAYLFFPLPTAAGEWMKLR